MAFVHLHNHTEHSALDGASRLGSMCARAAELGQNAMAISDHGSLAGAWKFTQAAKAAGIKPVIAIELYMAIGSRFERNSEVVARNDDTTADADEGRGDTKEKRYEHLTVIARNETGWKNLLAIHNKAEQSFWYKPRADYELLKEHGEGLIVLTGCLAGPVAGPLSRAAAAEDAGDTDAADRFHTEARRNLDTLIDCVGRENVYLEVMYHGIDAEKSILKPIGKLSREYGIPMVATNDCHYEREEHADHHAGFLAVGSKKGLDDPARFKFNGHGYYIKSEQEMLDIFPGSASWADAVAMSQVIADRCDDQVIPEPHQRLPKFPIPDGFADSDAYLKHLVKAGAVKRYGAAPGADVADRLRTELGVISRMGFPDYFLIVWDVINWCRSDAPVEFDNPDAPRKKPILVGPGRGSAAGSCVSFCLEIVGIDPLANNLLFERFLEEGRAGMPDIDVDFEKLRRDEVFAYLAYRWGQANVARIGTFGMALAKAAIKDAARILKPSGPSPEAIAEADELFAQGKRAEGAALMKRASKDAADRAANILRLGNKLSDLVPGGAKPYTFAKLEDTKDPAGQAFRELVEEAGQDAQDILTMAKFFEGIIKNESIHACGFVVSPEPLDELVPLRLASHAENADPSAPRVICWDGPQVESYGFLKMDILGLLNLDIISMAFDNIAATTGEHLDMGTIPHPDTKGDPRVEAAYELIGAGRTASVFQMESSGMKKVAQDVVPSTLTDLSAIVALFRPGPLAAKVPDLYAARKNGREPVDYDQFTADPTEQEWIASVLDNTYGLFCVAEGEKVYSATRGLMVPIEDLGVGELVQGVDSEGRHVLAPVTAHAQTGHRRVFRVTLADGKSVRLTDDHPVLTQRGWVAVGNLRADDSIATPWKLLEGAGGAAQLDPSEGRLLGYLLGDGTLSSGACGQFTNRDEGLHADFGACVSSVFPGHYASKIPNTIHSAIRGVTRQGGAGGSLPGKPLLWLRELGLVTGRVGLKSNSKHIPAKWLAATGEAAWSLVGALWDCDGRIGPRVAAYKTISKRLCDDLVYMLLRLGFTASVTTTPYTNPDGRREIAYHLGVVEVERFKAAIRPYLRSTAKQTACDTHIKGQKRVNHTLGSLVSSAHVRELAATSAGTVGRAIRLSGLPKASARTNKFIGHMMMEKFAAGTGSEGIARLLGSRWVPIRSIVEDGFSDVYDISVEGVSSFVAEGLVVHNCFQEDLMRLGTVIAGFDAGQRSTLRRAVGKKKKSEMDKVGQMLLEGAEQEFRDEDGNVISPVFSKKTAAHIFELMQGSAEYLFNASHSAAYAYLAYVTAFLKANWPTEYGAADLAIKTDDDKRLSTLQSLRADGIVVQAPDVNRSLPHTAPVDGAVHIGLSEVKEVGSAGRHIVAEREANGPFTSLHDLLSRVRIPNPGSGATRLSAGAVQGLIEAGALDSFGSRLGLLMSARAATDAATDPVPAAWSVLEEATRQRQRIGVCLGTHPLTALADELREWRVPGQEGEPDHRVGQAAKPLHRIPDRDRAPFVTVGVVAQWAEKAYSGGRRANFTLESSQTTVDGVAWDSTLTALRRAGIVPKVGDVIAVSGTVRVREVEIGDEEAGTRETVLTKELGATGMWPIQFPEAPVVESAEVFDFAEAYQRLRALPAPKASSRAKAKPAPEPQDALDGEADGPEDVATVTDLAEHRKGRTRTVVLAGELTASSFLTVLDGDEALGSSVPVPPVKIRKPGACLRFARDGEEYIFFIPGSLTAAEMYDAAGVVPADSPRWVSHSGMKGMDSWWTLEASAAPAAADEQAA